MTIAAYDPITGRVMLLDVDDMDLTGLATIPVGPEDEGRLRGGVPYHVVDGVLVADADVALAALRTERNRRLADCDWTQMPDAPLSGPTLEAWRSYRQQLRDLPEAISDPWTPIWPERPDAA